MAYAPLESREPPEEELDLSLGVPDIFQTHEYRLSRPVSICLLFAPLVLLLLSGLIQVITYFVALQRTDANNSSPWVAVYAINGFLSLTVATIALVVFLGKKVPQPGIYVFTLE